MCPKIHKTRGREVADAARVQSSEAWARAQYGLEAGVAHLDVPQRQARECPAAVSDDAVHAAPRCLGPSGSATQLCREFGGCIKTEATAVRALRTPPSVSSEQQNPQEIRSK